jgi:hypothetical protein
MRKERFLIYMGFPNVTDFMGNETTVTMNIENKVVLDNIVKKNEWKTWSFVETVPVALENGNLDENIENFKYDMRKCRKNITYYSKYEFPVFFRGNPNYLTFISFLCFFRKIDDSKN